jgi:hypothetical protein
MPPVGNGDFAWSLSVESDRTEVGIGRAAAALFCARVVRVLNTGRTEKVREQRNRDAANPNSYFMPRLGHSRNHQNQGAVFSIFLLANMGILVMVG